MGWELWYGQLGTDQLIKMPETGHWITLSKSSDIWIYIPAVGLTGSRRRSPRRCTQCHPDVQLGLLVELRCSWRWKDDFSQVGELRCIEQFQIAFSRIICLTLEFFQNCCIEFAVVCQSIVENGSKLMNLDGNREVRLCWTCRPPVHLGCHGSCHRHHQKERWFHRRANVHGGSVLEGSWTSSMLKNLR